jgi:hypothetical protein
MYERAVRAPEADFHRSDVHTTDRRQGPVRLHAYRVLPTESAARLVRQLSDVQHHGLAGLDGIGVARVVRTESRVIWVSRSRRAFDRSSFTSSARTSGTCSSVGANLRRATAPLVLALLASPPGVSCVLCPLRTRRHRRTVHVRQRKIAEQPAESETTLPRLRHRRVQPRLSTSSMGPHRDVSRHPGPARGTPSARPGTANEGEVQRDGLEEPGAGDAPEREVVLADVLGDVGRRGLLGRAGRRVVTEVH